jgi:enolase
VGDDLFVTNPRAWRRASRRAAGQFDPVKVNQIGSLTETLGGRRDGAHGAATRP